MAFLLMMQLVKRNKTKRRWWRPFSFTKSMKWQNSPCLLCVQNIPQCCAVVMRFFWAAIAVVEAKLEQFDDCLQDELSEMLPPHGYQIWFRVGRVSLSARSRPERFPCHGFPYPVSLVPFSLDYPIVSFLESCFPLNL